MTAAPNPQQPASIPTTNHIAERATCGALLTIADLDIGDDAETAARCIADLAITLDLFTDPACRALFAAIADIVNCGQSPTISALAHRETADARLADFERIRAEYFSPGNLAQNVRQLAECRQQRAILKAQSALATAAESGRPAHELQTLLEALETAKQGLTQTADTPPPFAPFTAAELDTAHLSPRCLVVHYLYADLALVCAAGGTGKTTLLIYEAVCIALGKPLWDKRVITPGKTLFITAEDPRTLFAARLREVMNAMNLTEYERRLALQSIAAWDVSCAVTRLAELDKSGNLQLTTLADQIARAYRDTGLVQVVFDPVISFSPGERMVNDGEQAIVTAARRIVRALGCCVRLVHHTGKQNARNGAADQYGGRGGTALPDGCRMVTILNSISDEAAQEKAPEGFNLAPGESGFILSLSKLSYAPPQPNIWIRRRGFAFEHFEESPRQSREQRITTDADRLAEFLVSEYHHNRRYTRRALDDVASGKLGMSRQRLRTALEVLAVNQRIEERDLPENERQGGKKTFLYCAAHLGAVAGKNADLFESDRTTAPSATTAPPL